MAFREFIIIFVSIFFDILSLAVLARVILSWLGTGGPSSLGRFRMILYDITEPVLGFFRRIIPRAGVFDFSPIVALITLDLARMLLVSFLSSTL